MKQAGIRPELIYAYEKTGMMVTEANLAQWLKKDLAEYEAAIDEYRRQDPKPEI